MNKATNKTAKKMATKKASGKQAKLGTAPFGGGVLGRVMNCEADSKQAVPTMDLPANEYRRGYLAAEKEAEEVRSRDPWVQHQRHAENVRNIKARLVDLENEIDRLKTRCREESAKRDGFALMIRELMCAATID